MFNWRRIDTKRRAYVRLFDSENMDARKVLSDLKKFCKMNQPAFVRNDPHGRESAVLAGRQEVFMRIVQYLNLSDEQIESLKDEV